MSHFSHLLLPPCEFNCALNPAPMDRGSQLQIREAGSGYWRYGAGYSRHTLHPRLTTPGKINYILGGVARNACQSLGRKPFLISVVGHDMAGSMGILNLQEKQKMNC